MKSNGKSSKPIIAAHTTKIKGHQPAPPSNGKSNGTRRVSRAARDKMKSLVLERISDGILAFDAEMNHVYVNERAGELLGREPQELLGKNFREEYPDSIGKPFADACQRAFETQTVVPFDGYISVSDTWVEARVYPSEDGISVLLHENNNPPQETKITEYNIDDISQFLQQNPNPVMRFTHDGKLLYANPASTPLLDTWKEQEQSVLPGELQELLFVVMQTGSNTELELENQGKIFSCLLVPVKESGFVNLYFSDITERKQTQESVNALIHQTTTGITRTDPQGRFLFVNQAFCAMVGYSETELLGKTIWEISHPDDTAKNKWLFERLIREGEPYQLEKRLVRRNGSVLWVTVGTSSLRDASGQTYAAVSVIVDITRRKRAEESLLDSARHTLYLASLSDAIRPLSSISEIETEAARLLGMHLKASSVAYATINADGTAIIKNNYTDGVADRIGTFNINEYIPHHLLTKLRTGRTVILSEAGRSARNSDALDAREEPSFVPTQVVIPLIRDRELVAAFFVQQSQKRDWKNEEIHLMEETAERMQTAIERARAETDLHESEERYRTIVETANEGIWEIDKDVRTVFVNQRMAEMLGYTPEEMLGRSSLEFLLPEDQSEGEHRLELAKHGVPARSSELRYRRKDGSILWTIASSTPGFDEQGNFVGGVAMVSDITERKQYEQSLIAYARRQTALYGLVDQLHLANTLENVFDASLDAISNALQCDHASILLFDETQIMHFVAWRGLSEEYRRATDGHSPWKYGEKNPKPIWYDDVTTSDLSDSLKTVIANEGIGSLAFIPLVYKGNLIGKFMVYFNAPHVFSQSELDLSLTIARQLASSVDRKRAEERLRASEDRLRLAVAAGNIGIWDIDLRRRERSWSKEGKALYGLAEDEFLDLDRQLQLTHPDDRAYVDQMVKAFRDQGTIKQLNLEHRIQHPDGSLHWVAVQGEAIYEEEPLPVRLIGTIVDITERKRAEEALRQSEERFARFMQYLPGLAWIKDIHGRYVYANAAAEQAFGVSKENLYGKTDADVFPPEIAAQFKKNDDQALMEARGVQVVEMLKQDDGVLHYSLVTKFPIPGTTGQTTLIGGTAFDITEQRQMENALRVSEELYRALVNQATAGIVRKDADGKLLFVNGAFAEMLGYSASELIDKTMWELTHPEDVPVNQQLYNRLITEGVPFQLEKRLIRRDGSILWATVSVSPVLDSTGKPQSAVSVYADITERKNAEVALNESRERYRDLFNLVPVAVYTCNADGLIREYNRSAVELWGREPNMYDPHEKYCGSFRIYHPDGRFLPHNQSPMARTLKGETLDPSELEILVERPDGSRRNVIAHPMPLKNEYGEITGAINCLYDMTDRKQAESRLGLLAEVSELTRMVEDPIELMSSVANLVGKYFQVKRCLFNEIDMQNDREVVHRDYHDSVDSVAGIHKLTEYSSITTAEMAAGKTIVNVDSKTDPRTANDYERSYVPNGERAYIAVPLMREERWVASFWMSDNMPRDWSSEEVSLVEAIAERTWTMIEKLRINAALRDSEERLRVTFNTTAVGFATLNLDTRFVEVNDAFCQIVGYSREELLEMNNDALTHPDYLESTHEHVAQLIAGEIPSFVLEKLYVRKNGEEIWVQNSVSLVRDAEDNPVHLIAISQDVTERKRTQDALKQLNLQLEERVQQRTSELQTAIEFLRESEGTSRLILESMPNAILIADKEGRIVYGNTQVESLFGYSPKEVIGQPVEFLIPKRFHENHADYRLDYGKHSHKRYMGLGRDLFGQRSDQSEFPVDVMLSPISNNTNWDVMVTIRDNTEQKQAQQALRANEEKLRKLFEVLPVGISFLDREGQITEMNSALNQILGLSRRELLEGKFKNRHYIRSDGSPMPPSEFATVRAHMEQRTVYNVETGIVKENGETIWTSVNAAPVDVAEVDVVVATIDITERKKAEDALHKNRERLRILSRRLVEVQEEERRAIARELHDRVGQNLAALNLNLNILRSQLSTEALQIIGSRLDDSVSLVNQILTITRNVMADLRSNVLDDYGLESALREYAEQFTLRTGVQVVTDKSAGRIPRLDLNIEMTLLRIAQEALTNVARHAQAKQATISLSADYDAVYMSIQDDGVGILSWQRANQPGSHGLRIIRERAEAFGGSLQVQSTYKQGTRIDVKIPLESGSTYNKVPREKRS